MCNKHLMWGQTAVTYTHTYTQSHTHIQHFHSSTVRINSDEKHTHSPKRWKPDKNAGWQGRQLVDFQIKLPVSKRNRKLGRQLSGILRKANKQQMYIYLYTNTQCTYVYMHDCLRSDGESASHSSPPQLKGVRVISACERVCVLTAGVLAKKSG